MTKKNLFFIWMIIGCFVQQAGAAELFLRIVSPGTYEVKVQEEIQISSRGKFRFFDLGSGYVYITIKDKNTSSLVYQGSINLGAERRTVAELRDGSLSVLETTAASRDCEFPGNGSYHGSHHQAQVCSDAAFAELMEILRKERIDSSLISKAKNYVPKANLSSTQVKQICDLLNFDSSKLEFAKYAYDYVVDPGAYFIINKTFKFSSSADELEKYVSDR